MNRLLDIGFQQAGHWLLESGNLKCELIRHYALKNILYAFVCDGQVKYVGKTIRALSVRMAGYRNPAKTQTTNMNNNRRIKELLSSGCAVEILALPDNGLLHYGMFHLNLAAALEDDIIRTIDPEWNGGKAETAIKLPHSGVVEPKPTVVSTFTFTPQPTYYRTGFFNLSVAAGKHIGADGETIELFLGSESQPILGTINRRANTNGTPRIMGGTGLRNWFNANSSVMGGIAVDVFSPASIRLKPAKG